VNKNFIKPNVSPPRCTQSSTNSNHTNWNEGLPKTARYVLEQITSQTQSNT